MHARRALTNADTHTQREREAAARVGWKTPSLSWWLFFSRDMERAEVEGGGKATAMQLASTALYV